jgi:peptidoglycan hydrolase-like protein with peptidoglycan-binding domain
MKLFDLFKKQINEGGNVSSQSPGWQGAADQEAEEIDLKIHNRDYMVGQLRTLLAAQNESFKAAYGKYIWDPKLLQSGKMFSGSSLQFFDIKGVNTQDFLNKLKKTKVGDIDTQINQDMGDEVTAWLKSIIGKKIGNGTFLGFNSSLSSIWLLDDPQVRVQVDYELGPYDPKTNAPTEWFAYSHSSHYDDMAAGIKGVFHKYINRALSQAQTSTKYVARVLKKGVKISDAPVTDSDYSFAVTSAQGGGMSVKYKPYIDPATGQPMEKDGVPVMQLLEPKDRDYIQNLDQQFQINFDRKRTAADQKLQGSFVGTIQLMNKSFTPEQNEAVARAFLDILFGPGAQMITKDDPARDRDVKFAAVDAMLLGGNGIKPLNLLNGQGLRQEAVKTAMDYADAFTAKKAGKAAPDTEVAEDAAAEIAAKPNYARQGIKHLYNRLPDGRISSAEMKDADFLEIAKEISNNGGTLDGLPISLKVDGAGIRFGKDQSGRPFFMTSKVTTPLYQDDVGYFTSFGQERGQDAEQLARTKNYDNALSLITGSKFIQTLPSDTIVQAEMMYNPMAEKTDQGLKFVSIPYDPAKLGGEMTLVPFVFKQYSTGEDRPDADKIKKRLLAASDSKIKIVTNQLEQKGINVSKIINPILELDPKDKANKPAFDKAKQELSSAIIDSPKLAGKDALGDNMEGIVVNMPNGQMFKVTSSQMKSAMTAKMAQPAAKRQGPLKTAVVAIGSFAGHLGHEDLFNATLNKAKELGGDPYLFIGNAVGEDDPIPTDVKVQTWHKLYPQYANNISAVMQGGSIMQKVKHELINPQPGKPPKYDNVIIMVGEDRANMPLAGALMKAVTKFPGYEHVKVTLETIPRTRPISFTKLRDVLKDPNATPEQQYAVWAGGFDEQKLGKDWILNLMDISRKGMGVSQATPAPAALPPQAAPQPVAEQRLFNALVRPRVYESDPAIRSIQHLLNKKGANLDVDGELGPLTKKSINKFLPKAPVGLAPEPTKNTAVQGKEIKELSSEKLGQYKKAAGAQASAADKVGNTKKADKRFSGIVKATKKQFANDEKGVAEGLSKRDQKDVDAIRAAIARLEAQLNHPNADRDAIQQSIAHEKKRLALYSVTEGAPIVVAQAPIDVRNPKKAPQPYRNQGDIVPPTKPPSTEKRGVKGRPGQRPMPDYDKVEEKIKGADGKACWKGYRYNGTENGKDKCVKVNESVENIMDSLINKIIDNEAIQNIKR